MSEKVYKSFYGVLNVWQYGLTDYHNISIFILETTDPKSSFSRTEKSFVRDMAYAGNILFQEKFFTAEEYGLFMNMVCCH